MNHAESGIRKRVSEPVYPADILGDTALLSCSLASRGAWLWTLCLMWRDEVAELTKTVDQWARIWGCSEAQAWAAIEELKREKVGDVTLCHKNVTLMSRRLSRRESGREQARLRKSRERTRIRHFDVTGENVLPSSSSSSSSSLCTKKYIDALNAFIDFREQIKKPLTEYALKLILGKCEKWGVEKSIAAINQSIESGWQGIFEPKGGRGGKGDASTWELKQQIEAVEKEMSALSSRYGFQYKTERENHPKEYAEFREWRKKRDALRKQIAGGTP